MFIVDIEENFEYLSTMHIADWTHFIVCNFFWIIKPDVLHSTKY